MAGLVADEDTEEWIEAARAYACRSLASAGRTLAAALVWQGLTDDDHREELRELIEDAAAGTAPDGDEAAWIPLALLIAPRGQSSV